MKRTRGPSIDYDDMAKMVRRYKKRGMLNTEIAKALKLSVRTVSVILKGLGLVDPKRVESGIKGAQKRYLAAQ